MTTHTRRRFLRQSVGGLAAAIAAGRASGAFAQDGCARAAALSAEWNATLRPMLASRYHRLHHCLFHYARNNWATLTAAQQKQLADLGWATPRPAAERAAWDQGRPYGNPFWATHNHSGEDFLFYHRWMIAMADRMLTTHKLGSIEPWSGKDAIPAPLAGCADEQIPDFVPVIENPKNPADPINITWLQLRVKEMKAPAFYWSNVNWWSRDYRDRSALRSLTLGELGARLEIGVHNQMHIRWAAYPTNGMKTIRDEGDFRPKWDDAGYDTLFDEYSSHISPIFFRLHKWIDDRIEDWAEAHGAAVRRAPTRHGFDWFAEGEWVKVAQPWTGAWGLEPPTAAEESKRVANMEQVTQVFFPPEPAARPMTSADRPPRPREPRRFISIRDPL